ncbi:glycosyltransferase [Mucilaginibacter sp. R-33]|uniref:glycosyltransferase n=1 Tax=unclassified Mucilaginibacter TaxID=2617802 RepID=UPI003CFABE35
MESYDNILSYVKELTELFVIDNSTLVNNEIVEKIIKLPNVTYINNGGNKGIAKALNIGAMKAFESGYQWFLTMDQDSFFLKPSSFFNIIDNAESKVGIYAASYTDDYDRWIKPYNKDFNEIHFVITSGNLINLKAWHKVHGFEEKLFIDEVDHDYCMKLRKNDYRILTTTKLYLQHSVGKQIENYDGKTFDGHSPVRYYYITRNTLYIVKKYFFEDIGFVFNRVRHLSKNLIKIVLFYPQKSEYLKNVGKGAGDFAKGRYGPFEQNNKNI